MTANVLDTYEPNNDGFCTGSRWFNEVPPVYVITPTYPRAEQIPELTRLGQALKLVDNLVWIVVDDADSPTPAVVQYFDEHPICHVYLQARMPAKYRERPNSHQPRGVANRRKAMQWLRTHAKTGGVFYFADDDNTYDARIFDEIRQTKKVSMFPVGFVTKLGVSSPIVRDGKVMGFYDGWMANRKFPVDMAGFAVNVQFFLSKPNADMPFEPGREETKFLESLSITQDDIEVLANGATKILVWHTKTIRHKKAAKRMDARLNYHKSNIDSLRKQI
ncbi:Glycosyl transferase family 43 [Trinorchestia longiramus]|nr:Glycosyl transferase family 43 [Trinorchestia longiramus]